MPLGWDMLVHSFTSLVSIMSLALCGSVDNRFRRGLHRVVTSLSQKRPSQSLVTVSQRSYRGHAGGLPWPSPSSKSCFCLQGFKELSPSFKPCHGLCLLSTQLRSGVTSWLTALTLNQIAPGANPGSPS